MNWYKTESTEYPVLLDLTSSEKVFVRRKVQETRREDVRYYVYEECKMTRQEYQEYASSENAKDNEAIMEALADIYMKLEELSNG